MKFFFVGVALIFLSCNGSLSREQRKKIRENMNAGAIKKISDAQLTEAALDYGRNLAKKIEADSGNKKLIDSLENKFNVEIIFMEPYQKGLRGVEQQILEAYMDAPTLNLTDNIQKMGRDSLLYTKPIAKERPDGSLKFVQALGIRIPKKTLILSFQE